ncbi:MAG: acyl carrier protein [Eubacterium sp.]|nr:acyl carrier protein [Eubacterium sp.]MBR3173482.1 acyl carrier protein [Eubacterium sp.]
MELEKLISVISEVLDIDASTITADSRFVEDLGADSLDFLEIVMSVEDEFGIKVPVEDVKDIATVKDAYEEIKKAL